MNTGQAIARHTIHLCLCLLICVHLCPICGNHSLAVEVSRAKADALIEQLPAEDPFEKNKDAGVLAWNEAYIIHAFIDLYEATGDEKYLHEAVRRGDRILSHRDDRRGFEDSSGIAHKRWSIGTKYTLGEAVLLDAAGQGVIKLRSTTFAHNHLTRVEVRDSDAGADRFTIALSNRFWKREETFSDLSIDPKHPRYFATVINDDKPRPRPFAPPGTSTEASQLLRAAPASAAIDRPRAQSLSLTPLWHAHVGYVGIIYHPMLRLAVLAKHQPEKLKGFKDAADRFTAAADESFAELESHWRDGPHAGEGYYINCLPGGAEAYDNVPHAFNYLGKLATSQLLLLELTAEPRYRQRATRIATLFKNRLRRVEGDRYVWNYWMEPITTGWTSADKVSLNTPHHEPWPQVEDTSHGALEVEMVVHAADAGIVFGPVDVQRFANTYLHNVVLPDRSGFFGRVDGTEPDSRYKGTRVVGWLSLAGVDRRVYDLSLQVYQNRNADDFRTVAALLKWQRRLENR